MPVYEYVCKSCGHHLEVSQSFKDAPLTTCPVCGGDLRKVFSSVGVILKGSGFYRTDSRIGSSREKAAKAGAAADKGDASGGSDGAGSKGDTASSESGTTSTEKSTGTPETKSDAKPAPKTGEVGKTAKTAKTA
jgi:putative FmdB family regulatory protein